ncbi:MAG: Glutathione S-transferase 2 [Sporothrix thermara]
MATEPPVATGLIATKGIELLTFPTINGFKASILLEELRDAYGIDYTWQSINLGKNVQKEPWFTAINPNGRIPAIVDHDRGGLAVFEGLAILNYLARRFDTEFRFSFNPATEPEELAIAESWLAWQHGGLGPMQGQAVVLLRFNSDKSGPFAIQRYVGKAERHLGVLDRRLADRDYIAGAGRGKYSIVDMATVGWASIMEIAGVDTSLFPNVKAWVKRCTARTATARGMTIPSPTLWADVDREKRLATPEAVAQEKALMDLVAEAQKQYDYKYKSP